MTLIKVNLAERYNNHILLVLIYLIMLSICPAFFPYFLAKHLGKTLKNFFLLARVMVQTGRREGKL